jgi:SAM-dependent methyltransferase
MDVREYKSFVMRHPWEIARVNALKSALNNMLKKELSVLDIGCGDGYVSRELFKDTAVRHITAVDINLSEEQIREFSARKQNIRFLNDYAKVGAATFGLILLLDVLEHVDDDERFLREIVEKNLAPEGYLVITAPMFQVLFTSHDAFLGHYRRYSLTELARLTDAGGLQCISSGYLFTSLLCARFLSACFQKVLKRTFFDNRGVGNWNHGSFITKVIASILTLDSRIALSMNRLGIKLPGLTGWVLCKKPQS